MPDVSPHPDRYKWIALSNTTIGVFMAMVNSSIVIIAMPAIFRGIELDPLQPSNVGYLLWMLMGYLLVSAVFVVLFGRLGDIFGRVRMYNLGFAVFTLASLVLGFVPGSGATGALELIVLRIVQGIGGALLMANSAAILTDAFPENQRGFALGLNQVAALAGSFVGLIAGGLLATWSWRMVFWLSVPFGLFGTAWSYWKLREVGERTHARIDVWGSITFAVGLTAVLIGITYAIQPYGDRATAWTSPAVLALLAGGAVVLAGFLLIERRAQAPMLNLHLFRRRTFAAGNAANLLASLARGGLQFMLILWLQGVWLPLHGYAYEDTPLWAGIYMLPLTGGFLLAGPLSGWLSDRYGARGFATAGLVIVAGTFGGLLALPTDFRYLWFALLLAANGIGSGLFAAPNTASIMNSVPAAERGAASGVRATFQNTGMVLSIGLFFSLLIVGLAGSLPSALARGLAAHGVPPADVARIAALPPVGTLFAAFLGVNPIAQLLGTSLLDQLPPAQAHVLAGRRFFPSLISAPFREGLALVFGIAIGLSMLAALASLLRSRRRRPPSTDHDARRGMTRAEGAQGVG